MKQVILMAGALWFAVGFQDASLADIFELDVVIDIPDVDVTQVSLDTTTALSPINISDEDTVRVNVTFSGGRRIMYPNDPLDSEEFVFSGLKSTFGGSYNTLDTNKMFAFTGVVGDLLPIDIDERPGFGPGLSIFVIEDLTSSSFIFAGFVWELADIGPLDSLPAEFNAFEFNLNAGDSELTIVAPIPIPAAVWLFPAGLVAGYVWMRNRQAA